MNYRHQFHAGNFADVFKHCVQLALLKALQKKEKPFCVLDTHAGIGSYDFLESSAQNTQEFTNGVGRLFAANDLEQAPTLIKDYVKLVKELNAPDTLRYYPGSPAITRSQLREHDRMILCELHSNDADTLKQLFWRDPQVAVHQTDGYQALKAFLPPVERRGLIFIDPPFEKDNEFQVLEEKIMETMKRWPTAMYAIWYPIKGSQFSQKFLQSLQSIFHVEVLSLRFSLSNRTAYQKLSACGMVIINPPWEIEHTIKPALMYLWKILSPYKEGEVFCARV